MSVNSVSASVNPVNPVIEQHVFEVAYVSYVQAQMQELAQMNPQDIKLQAEYGVVTAELNKLQQGGSTYVLPSNEMQMIEGIAKEHGI